MKAIVVLSILFSGALANAELIKKMVEYKDAGHVMEGYLVYESAVTISSKRPGVLVTHNWLGLTDATKEKSDAFASRAPYPIVFAVDVFGKGVRPSGEEAAKVSGIYKSDRDLFRKRMNAGLKTLTAQKNVDQNRIVAAGYCFGGTGTIELARSGAPLKGFISIHGGLDSPKPELGKKIKGRVLALHGSDDPYVSEADLKAFENEMRQSKVDWQLIKYGNAVHSFTDKEAGSDNSKGAAYNKNADQRSWEAIQQFMTEVL